MSGQGQDVWQELLQLIAEVELQPFLEISNLKDHVIQYLKGGAVVRFYDGLSTSTFLDLPETFWEERATELLNKIAENPSSYVHTVRHIKCAIAMDWWINGKPQD